MVGAIIITVNPKNTVLVNKTKPNRFTIEGDRIYKKVFAGYYSIEYMSNELDKGESIIYRSLLRHGYYKFSLEKL